MDFWVGDRLVRPSLGEIRLGLERVRLEPRSISVLIALAERPRQVIPKKELIRLVWGGSFVSDEVLTHAVWDLRRAFGDNATNPEFIQTIPKRGYRLIAPVREAEADDLSGIRDPSPKGSEDRRSGYERRSAAGRSPRGLRVGLTIVLAALATVALVAAFWTSRSPDGPEALEIESALAEIRANELSTDPDVAPWLGDPSVDPRAVRDFLDGLWIQYRNERGAEHAMRAAMARSPDFVAPWVFQAAAAYERGDPAEIRRIRENLLRLRYAGTGFENAMIQWALAVLDDSPSRQVRFLRQARDKEPANRLVRLLLAIAYGRLSAAGDAWNELRPLVEEQWRFPGVYTLAAVTSVQRGAVEDLETTLQRARENNPIDPEILDLSRLLALYRDDDVAAGRFADGLALRVREMEPEVYEFDPTPVAELLALRAEDEGNPEIARRLRESVD